MTQVCSQTKGLKEKKAAPRDDQERVKARLRLHTPRQRTAKTHTLKAVFLPGLCLSVVAAMATALRRGVCTRPFGVAILLIMTITTRLILGAQSESETFEA
jgi:hypothetical protein